MLEIEIKVKVPSLERIRTNILANGGKMNEKVVEQDTYYNAPHKDFGVTDEALRIRDAGGNIIVTYKGPKTTILGSKIREEINMKVESLTLFDSIITKLGFKRVANVCKTREYYVFGEFSIALDEVDNLGTFVEVELITDGDQQIAAEKVDTVAKKLEINGDRHTISYLELLMNEK